MIESRDRVYLVDLLIQEIASNDAPRADLCLMITDHAFAAQLTTSQTPATLIEHAVTLCIADQWKHAPSWLGRLVNSALLAYRMRTDPRLQVISAAIANPPPMMGTAARLLSTLLNKGTPFVNRTRLRNSLVYLESDAARQQPILIVNGPSKVGKSYTSRYVEHFAFTQDVEPRIISHRVEFKPDLALSLGPEQLAKDLVYSLARPFANQPTPETNRKLFARQLAAWVLSEAVQTGVRHWFVFDGFLVDPLVPETLRPRLDTLDFLIELSNLVTGGAYVEQCRLILTGFDRALLTVDPGKVDEEAVKPCTRDEAGHCLDELLQQAPSPLPQETLDKLKRLLLDGLPPSAAYMPELNMRLRALFQAMSVLNDILASVPSADYAEVLITMLTDLPAGAEQFKELTHRLDALRAASEEEETP